LIDVDLLLAFTTGMVVTVNPCGFAMLPAYLSFFVGSEGDATPEERVATTLARALVVGAAVTVGFVATFAVVGAVVNTLTDGVYDVAPWVSVAIGVALVAFGIALLAGFAPTFVSPHLERGGRSRGIGTLVLFGVSYAVASIGCSLPLFLTYMVGNFGRGVASGAAYLVAYALGFGLLITALTVTLGLGRRSLAIALRKVLPFVNRIAGGLLVIAGAYVAYYGSVEIRSGSGQAATSDGITDRVSRWSSDASTWIQDVGAERIGVVLGLVVAAAIVAVVATRRRSAARL
jgi:cytochrome c biogenesis protein CcdA